MRELRDKCEALADAPRAYPLVPRYGHFGIRRRPHLIFHRIGVDAIHIVHILHGAQNYEPILFPEE